MKKHSILFIGLLSFAILVLSACSMLPGGGNTTFDNNNLTPVEGQDGYYTSEDLALCTEIRGSYTAGRAFSLDEKNENLRVWDNLYLYEGDYFQMVEHNGAGIFYAVNDEDLEYVIIEDKFAQATIKEGCSGIYKLSFDLSAKLFDLEFKSEITTPVYEPMRGCDVFSLKNDFTVMTENPDNREELMVSGYYIEAGSLISFHNHGDYHLSNYKVILDGSVQGKYATAMEDGAKHVSFAIGGLYNLYINPVTYELRVELTNPDTAEYVLQIFKDGEPYAIEASEVPYIFNYTVTVSRFKSVPTFVGGGYVMYDLDVLPSGGLMTGDENDLFAEAGTYKLTVNLKTFEITVELFTE